MADIKYKKICFFIIVFLTVMVGFIVAIIKKAAAVNINPKTAPFILSFPSPANAVLSADIIKVTAPTANDMTANIADI